MKKFFVLLAFILAAFSVCFMSITKLAYHSSQLTQSPDAEAEMSGDEWYQPYPHGTMFLAWWSFLGDYGEALPVMERTYSGVIVLGAYVVLSQILLANLLVALMTDSYSDIRENSEREWKFNRFAFLDQYSTADVFPPPFNLLSRLFRGITNLLRGALHDESNANNSFLSETALIRLERKRDEVVEDTNRADEKSVKKRLKDISEKLDGILASQRLLENKVTQFEMKGI
jgi:hypothetical protein